MLIDAFLLHDELSMLEFRLRVLSPLVDKFVIVEADRTFSGNPKPYYLQSDWERFQPFHDKIIYEKIIIHEDLLPDPTIAPPTSYAPEHQCWRIEHAQRDAIVTACEPFPSSALILLGDVDEIPKREAVHFLVANSPFKKAPVVMLHHLFCYNLRFLRTLLWHGTIFTDIATLREEGAQGLRSRKDSIADGITDCGWHLSWFGTPETVRHKIESFSHQEYNTEKYKDPSRIAHCMETGDTLLDNEPNAVIYVAPQAFPDYFREHAPKEWWGV